MIRIGVFSDSHGDVDALKLALNHAGTLDYMIHCGDGFEDLEKLLEGSNQKYVCVYGNCDFNRKVPGETVLEIDGRSIFITHGHKYDVKFDYTRLFYKTLEVGASVALFGHTHVAEIIENDQVILMNPGSVGRATQGMKPSYGLIEIEHNILNCTIINFR